MIYDYENKENCIKVYNDLDFIIKQLDFSRERVLKLITNYYEENLELKEQVIQDLQNSEIDKAVELLIKIYYLHQRAINNKED